MQAPQTEWGFWSTREEVIEFLFAYASSWQEMENFPFCWFLSQNHKKLISSWRNWWFYCILHLDTHWFIFDCIYSTVNKTIVFIEIKHIHTSWKKTSNKQIVNVQFINQCRNLQRISEYIDTITALPKWKRHAALLYTWLLEKFLSAVVMGSEQMQMCQ